MSKQEAVKKYKEMVVFQVQCFIEKNWFEYDRAEEMIRKLEGEILRKE